MDFFPFPTIWCKNTTTSWKSVQFWYFGCTWKPTDNDAKNFKIYNLNIFIESIQNFTVDRLHRACMLPPPEHRAGERPRYLRLPRDRRRVPHLHVHLRQSHAGHYCSMLTTCSDTLSQLLTLKRFMSNAKDDIYVDKEVEHFDQKAGILEFNLTILSILNVILCGFVTGTVRLTRPPCLIHYWYKIYPYIPFGTLPEKRPLYQ